MRCDSQFSHLNRRNMNRLHSSIQAVGMFFCWMGAIFIGGNVCNFLNIVFTFIGCDAKSKAAGRVISFSFLFNGTFNISFIESPFEEK